MSTATWPRIGLFIFACWGTFLVGVSSQAQERGSHKPSLVVVIESHSRSISSSKLRSTIANLLGIPVVPLSGKPMAQLNRVVCIFINPKRELSVLFYDSRGIERRFTFTPESYGKDSSMSIANIVVSLIRSYRLPEPVWRDPSKRPEMRFNPYFDRWNSPERYLPSYSLPPVNPYYYAPKGRKERT